jgi:putative resolvase
MKLSEWAKKQGITYKTAWRWWKAGQLPVSAIQMPSGTVVVQDTAIAATGTAALYARVSSSDQKKDLEAQLGRLVGYASSNGYNVAQTAAEVGSGLNGHRPKLMKLLADSSVTVIIVEHRDRLMRFGAEYVESALAAQGRKIVVIDPTEVKDDLIQDMIEVLTSFCARLYGSRSARNKAQKAMDALHE